MTVRRMTVAFAVASFLIILAAVAAVGAFGGPAPLWRWSGDEQRLPNRVVSGPRASDASADTRHVLAMPEGGRGVIHRPLQLADGTRVEAGRRTDGAVCFNITMPGRPNAGSCGAGVEPDRISGVVARSRGKHAVYAGVVGDNVKAVIVETDRGEVEAVIRNGAFMAKIEKGAQLEAWRALLFDGSTTTGSLAMTNAGDPLVDE